MTMTITRTTPRRTPILPAALAALVTLATIATPTAAAPPPRAAVERVLSAIEKMPSKTALLRLYGPDFEKTLQAIVTTPSRAVLARVRALTTLRYFPTARTRELLRAEIAHTKGAKNGLPLVYLGQALRSYAIVAGPKALPTIVPLFVHPSIDIRVAVGEALRLSHTPTARTLIAARAKHDPSATVRAELSHQLALIDRAISKRHP